MNGSPSTEDVVAGTIEASRLPIDSRCRLLLAELWKWRDAPEPPALPSAEALAQWALVAGLDDLELLRRVLSLGRGLVETAQGRGLVDPATAARLHALTDDAAMQALEQFGRARHERRERWLSHLSHELKNPLNTILNSLWLLRAQRDAKGGERFFELAERAVRRIEAMTREIRDLQSYDAQPPPSRTDLAAPPPADSAPAPASAIRKPAEPPADAPPGPPPPAAKPRR